MIMSLTAEFVKALNKMIPTVDVTDKRDIEDIRILKNRIVEVMKLLEKSEDHVNVLLSRLESNHAKTKNEIVYVRSNGDLKAIVSPDIIKPEIFPTAKLKGECKCFFRRSEPFEGLKEYSMVDTEKKLREIDSSLKYICLEVFDHSYRSFEGFSCYLAIYTPSGHIHIVDGIKFREIIPCLRMLTCEVKKIIHCQRCVERLITDFGSIGCYQNFNTPESDLFVDWRIRPLDETLVSIICQDLQKMVEKFNSGTSLEHHTIETIDEVEEFAEKFHLPASLDTLAGLLRLRTYLAKANDESNQYVMTDTQLYSLIINSPSTIDEFEHLLGRMSSVLRLHASDFLLILKKRSGPFSLESLKSKQLPLGLESEFVVDDKYRQFGNDTKCALNHEFEDESSLNISAE